MNSIDSAVFYFFYGLAGKSQAGDFLIIFFGEYFLYVALAVFGFFCWRDCRRKGIGAAKIYIIAGVLAFIARFGIAEIIRFFYHRVRPYAALGIPHILTDTAYSFPSGHTIFMFALATAAYFFNKKLAVFLYVSGILIAAARVSGGVHYPSDILAGAVIGTAFSALIFVIFKKLFKFLP